MLVCEKKMELYLIAGAFILVIYLFIKMFEDYKLEKSENEQINKRLNDEFIYEPETGVKLTLEQAESGHWISHNNVNRIKSEEEIKNNFFNETEIEYEYLKRYLFMNNFVRFEMIDEDFEILSKTSILKKYDDWKFFESFSNNKILVSILTVYYEAKHRQQSGFNQRQIILKYNDLKLSGHYYFRSKTISEVFTDKYIRNDDDIKLENFECFTLIKSSNVLYLNNLIKKIDFDYNIEIEILDGTLILKNINFSTTEEFIKLNSIFEKIF